METQSREKQRAANIIWNAAGDYSFQPETKAYDQNGKADLYWNYILGAVRKYYDYPQFQLFFYDLKKDRDHVFYESLTWIGLENACYEKGKNDRPVLEDLRRIFSKNVLDRIYQPSLYYLVDEIKTAHFRRALGQSPQMREQVAAILNDLEFDGTMNTIQIIDRMNEIIEIYFHFNPASVKKERRFDLFERFLPREFSFANRLNKSNPGKKPFLKRFKPEYNEFSSGVAFEENNEQLDHQQNYWINFIGQIEHRKREDIETRYGISILPESQTIALEKILCVENHKNSHLHITRGEFPPARSEIREAGNRKNKNLNQPKKNRQRYKANFAQNHNNILRLTSKIKNALSIQLESSFVRSETGRLIAGKVWRSSYLHDDKIFLKELKNDIGNLSVDILLDASGSQMNRQEILAAEGFIIAESLTRCQIPVSVYSFCTKSDYTIINLFRDYDEVDKNERIFNYQASGCNRDGLAIRTALHRMKKSSYEHKLLIVLSDVKPLDPQGIACGGFRPDQYAYADAPGVNDTAAEVRKGRQNGITVLCVFTGLDEDLPTAKKIYGHDLARIHSPEKFADVVGILIQNVLHSF